MDNNSKIIKQVVEEEVWTNSEGCNVFDQLPLLNQTFETHVMELLGNVDSRRLDLFYVSYAEDHMTPLDMAYEDKGKSDVLLGDGFDTNQGKVEYYDGTGTLVWLAAKALVWLLDQDSNEIRTKYLRYSPSSEKPANEFRVYELGCGTGLPGIASLLLGSLDQGVSNKLRVCFTDSDKEALENCQKNCELNKLDDASYTHEVLQWWDTPITSASPSGHLSLKLQRDLGIVQTVLAADVLYDMKMIPPLLQTAYDLLQSESGTMILSHVPRFCLPRRDNEEEETPGESLRSPTQPFDDLENHILQEAQTIGFHLLETIRPHKVLQIPAAQPGLSSSNSKSGIQITGASLKRLQEMHSVVLIFRKI